MRTLFEDTNENADREDAGSATMVPLYTWALALLMLGIAVSTYFWVQRYRQQHPVVAPVIVSVNDPTQVNQAINRFNNFVVAGNWPEAEAMLSNEAKTRLATEKKTLRESLLASRLRAKKDDKLKAAVLTPSISRSETTFRVDCAYLFEDKEEMVVPITVIQESDRLVINSW
jgi:hypothetical protein